MLFHSVKDIIPAGLAVPAGMLAVPPAPLAVLPVLLAVNAGCYWLFFNNSQRQITYCYII